MLDVCVCVCVTLTAAAAAGRCWADAPCMAGSGSVPGSEAAIGCLCLWHMWRREEEEGGGPGAGLEGGGGGGSAG